MRQTKGGVWPKLTPNQKVQEYHFNHAPDMSFGMGIISHPKDAVAISESGMYEIGLYLNRMDQLRPDKSKTVLTGITA